MTKFRKTTAAVGAAALMAAPLTLLSGTAHADGPERTKEFRVAGAEVDFKVEKDDGRFEVEVDIDDAAPGSRWKVVLKHDGRLIHRGVHRADDDGDVEVDKERRNTRGTDTFKAVVKKIGGGSKSRTIRMR